MALGTAGDVHFDDGRDQTMADSIPGDGRAFSPSIHHDIAPPRDNGAPDSDDITPLGVSSGGLDGACRAGRGSRLDANGDTAMAGSTALGGPEVIDSNHDGAPHQRGGGRRISAGLEPAVDFPADLSLLSTWHLPTEPQHPRCAPDRAPTTLTDVAPPVEDSAGASAAGARRYDDSASRGSAGGRCHF